MRVPNYSPVQAAQIQDAAIKTLTRYSNDEHFYSDKLLSDITGVPVHHIRFLLEPFVSDGTVETRNSCGISYRLRKKEN